MKNRWDDIRVGPGRENAMGAYEWSGCRCTPGDTRFNDKWHRHLATLPEPHSGSESPLERSAVHTLSHTHTHTLTRARSATTAFIGVTDVFCNPVAPNAVDTWRSHLDQSSGAPQTVCVCVFRVFRGGVGVNMCVCCVFPWHQEHLSMLAFFWWDLPMFP